MTSSDGANILFCNRSGNAYPLIRIGKTNEERKVFYNFNKVVRKLAQEKQKQEIDNKEVADRLNVRLEVVEQMAQRLKTPELSIHAPLSTIHPEGSSNLIDMLADEEDICPESRLLYMD